MALYVDMHLLQSYLLVIFNVLLILENLNVSLSTGIIETDFIKYNGTYGDNIQGNVDASFVLSGVSVQGKDSSKLQSSFGSLKKEEVDVQKLLRDSKDRLVPHLFPLSCLMQFA